MSYLNGLEQCVDSLQTSIDTLSSSIVALDSGIHDFPRIKQVLKVQRHFHLISEQQLQERRQKFDESVKPYLLQAFQKLEDSITALQRQEDSLRTKYELQEARLDMLKNRPPISALPLNSDTTDQLKTTIAKRQKLLYTLERYDLQLRQKRGY
ncbi:DASH complex subunit Spc19 [Schizosaccharomyces cryophilus OY26]|uniref:DASH complex subunit SPC19 n=1 Tax=Schizosaccharomyces cryophilus (strain OY26 / ATCC MYA-4695 / CBS 11777 / NBRC 106824 / NRRL Y48691) TaxID=653667 RepID=S9VWW1_SCHCR|nr:DASH complex subunit Spc19 [Schizosaccharomyces cryophilus OY26]EPY52143.1 DASH complex subunit Spc19 [Schizosaccharomyces cryophilus OY26]